jgi:SapC protein
MAKQLLIYDQVVPVSPQRHGKKSIKAGTNYSYARGINSVPLMAAEFEAASFEYAIVFAGEAGSIMPVALLGLRDGENTFVDAQGAWTGKYVPAFVRQYPFVFASTDRGDTFTLCVDETFAGLNEEGLGERLFDAAGTRTQYLQSVLGFLQAYQAQFRATRRFVQRLEELKLLDAMEAQFALASGQQVKLGGFHAVNRERLRAVEGDVLAQFARGGELDLIYSHIHSLRNLAPVAERIRSAASESSTEAPAPETAPAADSSSSRKPRRSTASMDN